MNSLKRDPFSDLRFFNILYMSKYEIRFLLDMCIERRPNEVNHFIN